MEMLILAFALGTSGGEWELNPPNPVEGAVNDQQDHGLECFIHCVRSLPSYCGMGNGEGSLMACCAHGECRFLELFKLNPEYSLRMD